MKCKWKEVLELLARSADAGRHTVNAGLMHRADVSILLGCIAVAGVVSGLVLGLPSEETANATLVDRWRIYLTLLAVLLVCLCWTGCLHHEQDSRNYFAELAITQGAPPRVVKLLLLRRPGPSFVRQGQPELRRFQLLRWKALVKAAFGASSTRLKAAGQARRDAVVKGLSVAASVYLQESNSFEEFLDTFAQV